MKRYTFRGGTHVCEHKDTAGMKTERLPEPASVCIPLSQHIGAPAVPVVAVGDSVRIGQKIGEVGGGLGCPVHASVSGTVKAIVTKRNAMGTPVTNIVIENDGLRTQDDGMKPIAKPLSEATPEEIVAIVREAGISGLGGATFPTYAKIQSAMGKATRVIVNCAECEPYLTANHRLLLERGEIVISGMEIVMRARNVTEGILAVRGGDENQVPAGGRAADRGGAVRQGSAGGKAAGGRGMHDPQCRNRRGNLARVLAGTAADEPHCDGDGRLHPEPEECPLAAGRLGAGADHLLRGADPDAEEDDLRRTHDGLCAL